jgi:hypothetical protein
MPARTSAKAISPCAASIRCSCWPLAGCSRSVSPTPLFLGARCDTRRSKPVS